MESKAVLNPMDLTGKQILVAGAASGIGRQVALHIHKLGANIILVDDVAGELLQLTENIGKERVVPYAFDLYNQDEIEPAIKTLVSSHGAFNGFVFCGGSGGVRPLSFTRQAFLHKMMNDNCYSFVEFVRCIVKKGCFFNGGSIVALSSVSSIKGLKSKIAYSASKAALDASVRCLAAELSEKKIRVNSILKGWVETDMQQDFIKNNMALNSGEDLKKQVLGVISPAEVANLVAFLLCDASVTITGTSVLLDGGYSI